MPPLNLVGDFGGGALYLVVGVLAALLEAQKSGKGQVVDAAMCDGAASLMSMFFDMTADRAAGAKAARAISSTAARISTASMNAAAASSSRSARSSRNSMRCCASMPASTDADFDAQMDRKAWPALKEKLTEVFKTKTRDEWCAHHGRHRHLLRAGPDHVGSARASAHGGAQDFRRAATA